MQDILSEFKKWRGVLLIILAYGGQLLFYQGFIWLQKHSNVPDEFSSSHNFDSNVYLLVHLAVLVGTACGVITNFKDNRNGLLAALRLTVMGGGLLIFGLFMMPLYLESLNEIIKLVELGTLLYWLVRASGLTMFLFALIPAICHLGAAGLICRKVFNKEVGRHESNCKWQAGADKAPEAQK